jgi:ABC-type Mn2+/Zn2+ transport system permease subunit
MTWVEFLSGPLSFELTRRALLEVTFVGCACGALGVLVMLRGLSFIGDGPSHTVIPGMVIGYLTRTSVELWGGSSALLSAWAMALFIRRGWLRGDASIAVVFTGAFALGLAIISSSGSYTVGLMGLLFGNILAVEPIDLTIGALAAACVIIVLAVLYRPLVLASFDPTITRALGLPIGLLDGMLYALIVLALVAGVTAMGSMLVTALLIVPPAASRLLGRQVWSQMIWSAGFAAVGGWIGVYTSYYTPVATGGAIVLSCVAIFILALLASPKSGARIFWKWQAMRRRVHEAGA